MKHSLLLVTLFLLMSVQEVYSQRDYCWFSYKPNTHQDSILRSEFDLNNVTISRIKKLSKEKNDTVFVRKFNLSKCENSILKECLIKKERQKRNRLIHVIEHKYSGNRYKLIHYFNSKKQISRTVNKLKKGFDLEHFMAFNKIKYEYSKDGLLIKSRFYLDGYTIKNKDYLSVIYSYKQ